MSQSPTDAEARVATSYLDGWLAMGRLVRQGLSWSGREPNRCFLNLGRHGFADVSSVAGLDLPDDGRALAVVDWDRDGALDLWVTNRTSPRLRLLRNRGADGAASSGGFVALRLEGRTCNRDAIGARVELVTAGQTRRQVRLLSAGDGFLAQSSKWLHFGLGSGREFDRAIVTWPGGAREEFHGLVAGRRHLLVQGTGVAEPLEALARPIALGAEPIPTSSRPPRSRALLGARVPLPPLPYANLLGRPAELRPDGRSSCLIVLWASWCSNCLIELKELEARAAELRAAGLRVIALCVDDETSRADAAKVLERIGWSGEHGLVADASVDVLRAIEELVLEPKRDLVLPMSFLVDRRFRLSAIYRGPVDLSTVLADTALPDGTPEAVRAAAQPFPGRWKQAPATHDLLTLAHRWRDMGHTELANEYLQRLQVAGGAKTGEAVLAAGKLGGTHLAAGEELARAQRYDEARAAFLRALELEPESARAHRGLGAAALELGDFAMAEHHLRRAVELEPQDDVSHGLLAMCLLRQNRLAEARAGLELALALNEANPKAHFNLAVIHQKEGEPELALTRVRHALELDPEYLTARRALATLLHARGDLARAIPEYERLVAANPSDGQSRLALGHAYLGLGDRAQAELQVRALEADAPELARRLRAAMNADLGAQGRLGNR